MLTSEFPPTVAGVSNYVYKLSIGLTRKGHKVTVITRGSWKGLEINSVDGINVYRLPFLGIYPFHLKIHEIFQNKIFKLLEPSFDLVHVHYPMSPLVHTCLPKVLTVHTLEIIEGRETELTDLRSIAYKIFSKFVSNIERQIINSADFTTTVSKSVAKEIIKYYGVKKQISIIGNGVDINFFAPKKDEDKESVRPYVLYVGRLGYRKGLIDLIESANYVCQKIPEAYFILIGRGPLERELKSLVKEMNLSNNSSFLGYVNRDSLLYYYQNAAVFVLPSYYEGLPTTLLEAMACGVPAIATEVDGVPEIITDGKNGFLVPKKDPRSIANAVLRLLGNTELRKEIGRNASEKIRKDNNWDLVCERVLNCYRYVVENQTSVV